MLMYHGTIIITLRKCVRTVLVQKEKYVPVLLERLLFIGNIFFK